MDILAKLLLSFERNIRHLVALSSLFAFYNDPMVSISQLSMLYSLKARRYKDIVSDTIERFFEVDEVMKQLLISSEDLSINEIFRSQ